MNGFFRVMWQAYISAYGPDWAEEEEWEGRKYLIAFWFQRLEGKKKMSVIYNVVTSKDSTNGARIDLVWETEKCNRTYYLNFKKYVVGMTGST